MPTAIGHHPEIGNDGDLYSASIHPRQRMRSALKPQLNMLALVTRVGPQAGELSSAASHLATVRSRLLASFDVARILRIGSHARDTAIRWHSDLDMLAVLRRNEAKWGKGIVSSSTFLSRVIDDLQGRFPHTEVRGDQQAAVIHFAAGQQSLDVVPAMWGGFSSGRPVYLIPGGNGDWLETSPEAHNRFFQIANARSGQKLKGLCKLLRWWKYSRAQPIPLLTFHTDMLLAAHDVCVGAKPYTACLYSAFSLLARRECRAFKDPVGIAGMIPAAKTEAKRQAFDNAVEYSLQHATSALELESRGRITEANDQWNIVFNGRY
jgi:hypothetical protein